MSSQNPPRRIVTSHDPQGKAAVLFDGEPPNVLVRADSGIVRWPVWVTDATPADISLQTDKAPEMKGLQPPPGGSVCRIIDFHPTPASVEQQDASYLARTLGVDEESSKGHVSRHPLMHRTRTIDYAIVVSGEIDMLLDNSEIHLVAGDVLVQQGTNHAWVNRGDTPCRVVFVLIDAKD